MSKGVKKVLGVVAAVAIPFAAPVIAGALGASAALAGTGFGAFLGTAGGSALTGAALGGATSALTGGDPVTGALLGGVGGFAGAGGFQGMFGGPAATSTNAVSGPMSSSLRPLARPAGLAAPATVSSGAAAPTTLGGFFQQVGRGFLNNPAGMAQLAMTVYGAPPQDLTPAELANLEELKGIAETNRELFEQRVREANEMIQMAAQQAPNPQQAFAETQLAAKRQLAEQTRGMSGEQAAFAQRRSGIRSTQAGATAAAAEEARGRQTQTQLLQAGLATLPSAAPTGYAGLALPTYQALQQRQYSFYDDLAETAGDMFGSIS